MGIEKTMIVGRANISWKKRFLEMEARNKQLQEMYEKKFAGLEKEFESTSNSQNQVSLKTKIEESEGVENTPQLPINHTLKSEGFDSPKTQIAKSPLSSDASSVSNNSEELEIENLDVAEQEMSIENAREKYNYECSRCGSFFNDLIDGDKCPKCNEVLI